MNEFVLSCCSTSDMSKEYIESRNIKCAFFKYYLNGVQYTDDFGNTIPYDEFYKRIANGEETKTSQVNVDEYLTFFEKTLKEGKDILHISFSSGLSGSYNSALIAKKDLAEKYPERKIFIVDSLCASAGYGLFVDMIADLRDEGKSIDEIYDWAQEHKYNIQHWFYSTDLTFYVKGGRVSKAAGWFGTILKICPLLDTNFEGKLIPRLKVRGKTNAAKEALKKMEERAVDGLNYSGKCFISNSGCYEDAKYLADLVEEKFVNLRGKVYITTIGTTIGSHTGPGTVALFFYGNKRVD